MAVLVVEVGMHAFVMGIVAVGRRARRRAPAVEVSSGLRLRYRRGEGPVQGPTALPQWQPQRVSVATLRRRGLRTWPDAVGVWWSHPLPSGALVCGACLADPRLLPDAVAGRHDDETALVLFGEGARRRVDRRCVVHVSRDL